MSMFPAITRAALDAAGLPTPAAVTDAETFATAVDELRAKLAAATPAPLETATASTAAKLITAHAEYDALHAGRVAAADRLRTIAADRIEQAWSQAATAHRSEFAAAFDRIAAEFGAALDARGIMPENVNAYRHDPGATDVFTLAGQLDALAAMRDEFAAQQGDARRTGTYSDDFERLTRHLRILDRRGATNVPAALHPQAGRGPEHWATAHRSPLFAIAWQELPQQRAQVAPLLHKTTR